LPDNIPTAARLQILTTNLAGLTRIPDGIGLSDLTQLELYIADCASSRADSLGRGNLRVLEMGNGAKGPFALRDRLRTALERMHIPLIDGNDRDHDPGSLGRLNLRLHDIGDTRL
jgi:hypothetical protein